jgi:hypothetical protein
MTSYSEGEFVKDCMVEVSKILCCDKTSKFEQISLSRRTVARRIEIDSIADDLKLNLTDVTKQFECFSIALDGSTDSSDTAQLAIFIPGVDTNFNYVEELLSLQ